MNNQDLLKKGIELRIRQLTVQALCYEAQGDYSHVFDINRRKIDLCLWLTKILFQQAQDRVASR